VIRYIGRPESASPAPGSVKRHQAEQADILNEATSADSTPRGRTRLVLRKKK
jgi:2-oxoglutarate dehydrogenase C-terminal